MTAHTCDCEPLSCLMRRALSAGVRAAFDAEIVQRVAKRTAHVVQHTGDMWADPLPSPAFLILRFSGRGWTPLPILYWSREKCEEHICDVTRRDARNAPHVILEVTP